MTSQREELGPDIALWTSVELPSGGGRARSGLFSMQVAV
jgi:hypothetical protein